MRKRVLSLCLAAVMALTLTTPAFAAKVDVSNMPNHALLSKLPETLQRPARPTTLEQAYAHIDNVELGSKWSDESTLREITDLTDSLTAGKTTDTQKMKAIFDWVSQNIEYDHVAYNYSETTDPWGRTDEQRERIGAANEAFHVYTNRLAVCDGYTDLCWLMGTIAGIPVAYIGGGATNGRHAWNAALADGKWLFFDATWGEWDMAPDYHQYTHYFSYYDGLYQLNVGSENISLFLRKGFQDQCPASMTIPGGVTKIDSKAFEGCTSLERVTIPDSVTAIEDGAFYGCTSLKYVNIPHSVTEIRTNLFKGCTSLENITIPNSVTRIWVAAFDGCSSLKSITIPGSVTRMDEAFYGCTDLESVTIEKGVTSIGFSAFTDCTSLKNVTIPDSVKTIEGQAFWNCTSLESVTIPDGVTSIGKMAFYGCTSLKRADLPDSVTDLDPSAFGDCPNLQQGMTIPGGMTTIPAYMFRGRTDLTSYVIPAGVTSIGYQAFQDCTGLTSITIPDSVTSIDNYAFDGCSSLTSVTIPAGVTEINASAFYGCTGLTSVTISDGVTRIGDSAFALCSGLTGVTIPNSVTSIGDHAFSNCSGLTSITIPDGVTSIGWSFNGCTGLKSIVIPNRVTSIGNFAFDSCTGLESVAIPKSVTSIDMGAFADCTSLTDIYYAGTEEQWKAIEISTNQNDALFSAAVHYNSTMPQQPVQPGTPVAYASTQNVLVDGKPVEFYAYALKDANGNDTNYVKLRDVAQVLNGSAAQFEVGWDGAISIATKTPYTPNGSEMIQNFTGNQSYTVNGAPVKVNGVEAGLEAITLTDSTGGGFTYFKLRDLGAALGFNVGWSGEKGVYIETDCPYDPGN